MSALLGGLRSQAPIVLAAALTGVVLVLLMSMGGAKIIVAGVGAVAIAAGAVLSGNIRLFCLWGFILTLPLDLSYRLGTIYPKLGGETAFRVEVSDVFWLPLLFFLVRDVWTGSVRGVRIPKVTYLWVALIAMGMLAVVTGPWRMTAMHEVVRMVKVLLIFIILCNELRTPGRFMQLALAIATAVLIQAAAGVTQYLTGSAFGLAFLGESEIVSAQNVVKTTAVIRVGAFMIHPVIFATFLATLLPIALGLVLLPLRPLHRLLFAGAVLLGLPALLFTLSRAGWLTFFITTMILSALVMFRPALRRRALIPLAGAGAVMLAVVLAFSGPIMARLFQSNPESEQGRDEWREDARRMIAERPILGWGLNSYAFAVPPFTRLGERGAREFYEKARLGRTRFIPVVHNAYLQWFAEVGIVGLALHLAIFVALIATGIRNLRVRNELLFVMNAACLAGIVGYLVDLNFGNSLRQGSTLREFWMLGAMICAIRYWRLRNEGPAAAPAAQPAAPSLAAPAVR